MTTATARSLLGPRACAPVSTTLSRGSGAELITRAISGCLTRPATRRRVTAQSASPRAGMHPPSGRCANGPHTVNQARTPYLAHGGYVAARGPVLLGAALGLPR